MKRTALESIPQAVGLGALSLVEDSVLEGISLVTSDSRAVGPGCVFVAISGTTLDGHQFLEQAAGAGAVVLVGEKPSGLPGYIQVSSSRQALAWLAAAQEDFPATKLKVIGITGTSGKTTTTFILDSIFRHAGLKTALIGTVENRIGGKRRSSTHSTPAPDRLQKLCREMVDEGVEVLVMEVSSHGLDQHRVDGIAWDVVGFLNLSPEHLDYHPTLEDYFEAKSKLFTERLEESRALGKEPRAVVVCSSSDPADWGRRLSELSVVSVIQIDGSPQENSGGFESFELEGTAVHSRLMGGFNQQNLRLAAAVAREAGLSVEQIKQGVEALEGVPGRMEVVQTADPTVLVDYAHKSDALEKVLASARALVGESGRLWVVFGCGGDRDRAKRAVMGQIAETFADRVVVTSDNPRTEAPEAIVGEILSGMNSKPYRTTLDRQAAIDGAVQEAGPGDVVVIAGKGHETYQIVGTQTLPFDDREVVRAAISHKA